ncbi:hypothetical protein [Thalassolituus sp. UBA2009]|jgi:hypothetical protein|uniref:hypothetical protein n=1 Tax=Thalassolituus sp. UBA2009 TaxID=1947658 RepID=UPI00257E2349|nr:hypothetical protein [Thalassolituus sp. UBA2009]
MNELPHRLGQLLLQQQSITEEQLQQALSYQAQNPCQLGQALIQLGFIDERALRGVLRRQRWLKPCAACFALIAPFSMTWADEDKEAAFTSDWLEASHWDLVDDERVTEHSSSVDLMKFVALTAWDIYQGEPVPGEVRYNVSQTNNKGYSLELSMRF